ncbi:MULTISPECIES: type I-C CRISPR-associated protein Cas7/Csd2 [Sphingomonas]|jgi:CRISPR-associated protein Csd2|uniref:type I-C CRISPR-associated protein Cas7/Csd2 n=2 Tax=Pseudomonadota TaxID=1224 RepID=UPI001AEAA1A6
MANESPAVSRRHEFILYFDVKDGNPNGDPDAGNMPRIDPETNQGLVSDVSLKRKVRNYIATQVAMGELPESGNAIYMSEGAVLNREHQKAWAAENIAPEKEKDFSKLPKKEGAARRLTAWMCANFWDIRTFGAVMTTEINAGQVRGPVQLAFGRSVEPILPLEISITRSSVTNEKDVDKERTMGRKHIVPYGLYRVHGFVSAPLASHPSKGTGFSEADLELLWQALCQMFDHDRSAARGEMAKRRLIVFRHQSALGNAQAQSLFDRVKTWRVHEASVQEIGSTATDNWPPARKWEDYKVTIDREGLPVGVEIIEPC